jgi:ferredoxin
MSLLCRLAFNNGTLPGPDDAADHLRNLVTTASLAIACSLRVKNKIEKKGELTNSVGQSSEIFFLFFL